MELRGLEPLTPTLPVWCATSCATAPYRARSYRAPAQYYTPRVGAHARRWRSRSAPPSGSGPRRRSVEGDVGREVRHCRDDVALAAQHHRPQVVGSGHERVAGQGKQFFWMFNNHVRGNMARNARTFVSLLEGAADMRGEPPAP